MKRLERKLALEISKNVKLASENSTFAAELKRQKGKFNSLVSYVSCTSTAHTDLKGRVDALEAGIEVSRQTAKGSEDYLSSAHGLAAPSYPRGTSQIRMPSPYANASTPPITPEE